MKTAPEYPWGGCLLRLNASGDNRPGAQGKLTLRARLHITVSFRAVPERHDSMIRDTHKRSNAIFAHLLPGQSHMVGAHPRSPVGLPAETPACTASSLARPTVCTRWRSARTGGSSPPSLGRHGPARGWEGSGSAEPSSARRTNRGTSRRADRRLRWERRRLSSRSTS